jgi:hypothetical protein
MGHPLGSFIQELLLTSACSEIQRERVSLVVDNARMSVSNPKDHALRKRFPPEQQPVAPVRVTTKTAGITRCPARKDSLDVSDHTRGESRWESTTVPSGSSVPVTPTRERRRKTVSSSPTNISMGTNPLSPVVEENQKKGQALGSKHPRLSSSPTLLDLQNSGRKRNGERSNAKRSTGSTSPVEKRNTSGHNMLHQVEEVLAICSAIEDP